MSAVQRLLIWPCAVIAVNPSGPRADFLRGAALCEDMRWWRRLTDACMAANRAPHGQTGAHLRWQLDLWGLSWREFNLQLEIEYHHPFAARVARPFARLRRQVVDPPLRGAVLNYTG